MDYKAKVRERWQGNTRQETSEKILQWLDDTHPGWKENYSGNIPGQVVLIEAIGEKAYEQWDTETSEEAEAFIMDYYLIEGVGA